jgi:hypothetical protein
MILRLSQKLAAKIKSGKLSDKPLDPNPYADWSCHLFTADRTQYILLSNTTSLYSCVMYGAGITDDSQFTERALSAIREFMEDDGQAFVYQQFIAPASSTVSFAKALNRSVTGSMTDLVKHSTYWLTEDEVSPHELGFRLNDIPMSALDYANPRERFNQLMPIKEIKVPIVRAKDQLPDEVSYPHLATFLRAGGTLEVGEDVSRSVSGLHSSPEADGFGRQEAIRRGINKLPSTRKQMNVLDGMVRKPLEAKLDTNASDHRTDLANSLPGHHRDVRLRLRAGHQEEGAEVSGFAVCHQSCGQPHLHANPVWYAEPAAGGS